MILGVLVETLLIRRFFTAPAAMIRASSAPMPMMRLRFIYFPH